MASVSKASQRTVSKLQLKSPATVTLEKIIGHTVSDKHKVTMHPITGDIAYLSGSIICVVNSKSATPIKHFFSKANRNFNSIAYSPNGDYLAAGEASCKQPEILVFEPLAKDEPVSVLKGHKSGVKALTFSADSQFLLSLGEQGDTRIILWDWRAGKRVDSKKMKREFTSLYYPPLGSHFVTTGPQSVKFWQIEEDPATKAKGLVCKNAEMGTRKDKVFIDVCCGPEITYALTESPANLCIVGKDRKAQRWMDLKAAKGFSCRLGTKYLLFACSDGIIRLFDPASLQHIATLPKPPALGYANVAEGVSPPKVPSDKKVFADTVAVELDEANSLVTAFYSDRSLITWDIKNLEKIALKRSVMPHSAPISDIQILPSSTPSITRFATCSTDCTVRFWHFSESGIPTDAARNVYNKDSYKILYTSNDHAHFKLRAIQQSIVMNQEGQMRTLKCSPDGKFIVCGDQNGALKIYDTSSGSLLHSIEAHNGEITCIDFVQDGDISLMASGSRDRLIHLFDCRADIVRKKTIEDQNSAVVALAFAVDKTEQDPDKRIRLITCGADKSLIFRYVSRELACTKYHQEIDKQSKPLCLCTNQYTMQAIVGQEKKISIWRISTGKSTRTFELKVETSAHPINNISILTDPTASVIITSCSDKVIKVRDFVNGRCVLKISNAGYTTSLALTPDCKRLITTSMEGCIMIWRLPEDLAAHCQKRMFELNLSTNIEADIPAKISKDRIIDEWEGVVGISKKQQARNKEAKESSEVALNAAAYVQNLLAKIKTPGVNRAQEAPKAPEGDEEDKEDKGTIEVEQNKDELSKYTIKEQEKGEPAEESNTEFEKETNQDARDAPARLSRSLPSQAPSVGNPSPEKKEAAAKSPDKEERKTMIRAHNLSDKELNRIEVEVKMEVPPVLEKDKKKEEGGEEKEKAEDDGAHVAVALEEEEDNGPGMDDEIDVLGQLLMKQRDVADEVRPPTMFKQRESLTSQFWQEKLKVDEELKSAYQQAHKNPNKRDKSDLIFPGGAAENVQTKLPNYKENAGTYVSMLKELVQQKPEEKVAQTAVVEAKKEEETASKTEVPRPVPQPTPAENLAEKPKDKEPPHPFLPAAIIRKENMEIQTETLGVREQVLEAMKRLVKEIREGKLDKDEGKAFISEKMTPLWEEVCEQTGISVDPIEKQTRELLEKYSSLLVQKVESKLKKQ